MKIQEQDDSNIFILINGKKFERANDNAIRTITEKTSCKKASDTKIYILT